MLLLHAQAKNPCTFEKTDIFINAWNWPANNLRCCMRIRNKTKLFCYFVSADAKKTLMRLFSGRSLHLFFSKHVGFFFPFGTIFKSQFLPSLFLVETFKIWNPINLGKSYKLELSSYISYISVSVPWSVDQKVLQTFPFKTKYSSPVWPPSFLRCLSTINVRSSRSTNHHPDLRGTSEDT